MSSPQHNAAEYDLIVCGAGPAGVSAALSAARLGVKTLLIESQGCLGGIWTSGLLSLVLDTAGKGGLLTELQERLKEEEALLQRQHSSGFTYDVEVMKWLLEKMCLAAGIDMLYHTRVVDAVHQDGWVKAVVTESAGGRRTFAAKLFVDATGNGDLAARCGCPYEMGHPVSGKIQPATLLAIVSGLPPEEQGTQGAKDKERFRSLLRSVGCDPSYCGPSLFRLPHPGLFTMMINHEYRVHCDNAAEITKATIHAREELNTAVRALRRLPGWENMRLVITADHIGIREGRRIKGRYYLTADDLKEGRRFEDGICLARFSVDIHQLDEQTPHGQDAFKAKPYHIPYRALVAAGFENLGLAGRCISGDFFAHASYRVTGNAVPMGEAIGIAAAAAMAEAGGGFAGVDGRSVAAEMQRRGYEI
ncbi:MAG TPA: FAD-dependent oxidoreductase [Firmicutes bacterium]|nr:FAD-dependent oxidoreductase [Bacillota bacterium]